MFHKSCATIIEDPEGCKASVHGHSPLIAAIPGFGKAGL